MKKLLFLILGVIALTSCEPVYKDITQYHYLTHYVNVDDIKCVCENQTIEVRYIVPLNEIGKDHFAPVSVYAKGDNKKIYDSLANKHYDQHHKLKIKYDSYGGYIRRYMAPYAALFDISSIEIYSADDFDEQHLAGTLLNDCFTFKTVSRYPYFKSNYKTRYAYDINSEEYNCLISTFNLYSGIEEDLQYDDNNTVYASFHYISKPLNVVNSEDLMLVGNTNIQADRDNIWGLAFLLEPSVAPTLSKMQNLTIKVNADNGRTYTAECAVAFD